MSENVRPAPRQAAVLLFIRPLGANHEPHLIFIRRTEKVYNHKGQISFPGGGYQPEDGKMEQTALRETHEELGIVPSSVRVLGALTPVDTIVTNYRVHPFVGVPHDVSAPVVYVPDSFEVAHVIEMPLRELIHPRARRDEEWVLRGQPRPVVFYNYAQYVIWGATAYILRNFIAEINDGKWSELFNL
jgi:8-oxo-dGTP pyrophosphatase MutT (NUDIX family)